jgi:GTPase SAR1 family protein
LTADKADAIVQMPEVSSAKYIYRLDLHWTEENTKLELKIRKSADIYIIDVNGEMDLYNSYKLKELVMKMLEKKIQKFIINMEMWNISIPVESVLSSISIPRSRNSV